jgi:hypothetical protein
MHFTLKELTWRDRCAFVRSITKEIRVQKQIHLGCEPDGARLGKDDLSLDRVGLVEQTIPLCIAGTIGGTTKSDPLTEQRPNLFVVIILPAGIAEGIAIVVGHGWASLSSTATTWATMA